MAGTHLIKFIERMRFTAISLVCMIMLGVWCGVANAVTFPCRPQMALGEYMDNLRVLMGYQRPEKPFKVEPAPERQEALERLEKKYPGADSFGHPFVTLEWDPITGLPEMVRNEAWSPESITNPPDEFAIKFLKEWRDLMGINPATLRLSRVWGDESIGHVAYLQVHQQLVVAGARVEFLIPHDGRIKIESKYYPDIHVPTLKPAFSSDAALKMVKEIDVSAPNFLASNSPLFAQLVIYPDCGVAPDWTPCKFHLAWRIAHDNELDFIRSGSGYFVDAVTGKLIGASFPMPVC